jgi:hypothetical protein
MHQLLNANSWPKSFNNKTIQHLGTFKFLNQHQNMWEVAYALQTIVLPLTSVFWLGYGFIYIITFGATQKKILNEVTIEDFPIYICMDFITMMVSSLGGCRKCMHCKHNVLHFTTCNVLWINKILHSSSKLSLQVGMKFNV